MISHLAILPDEPVMRNALVRTWWPAVPLKVSEIIKMIEADCWYLVATRGSHRQYKHPDKPGRVTVAGKPSQELPPGTERSILKQAGI
jgi:predicted RNA binding protein YcfA (HicA-like mRNA interferase family)